MLLMAQNDREYKLRRVKKTAARGENAKRTDDIGKKIDNRDWESARHRVQLRATPYHPIHIGLSNASTHF